MIDLMKFCEGQGFEWVHIKTDSIKLVNATQKQIDIVTEFSSNYGYKMVHEATYEKMCLVNNAVYVAKYGWAEKEKLIGTWVAVGKEFQHAYVYKTLFSHEEVTFADLGEVKQVKKGTMYLDFKYDDPPRESGSDGMAFVGRIGKFVPVTEGSGGAALWRIDGEKVHSVNGAKGHFWMEADMVESKSKAEGVEVDYSYFDNLVTAAVAQISKFGDFSEFVK